MYSNKFKMFETLFESFSYLINGFGRYALNSVVIVVSYLVSATIIVSTMFRSFSSSLYFNPMIDYSNDFEAYSYIFGRIAGMFFMMLPVIILVGLLFITNIKITDDTYEKRHNSYGKQLKFVFKRTGRIILANIGVGVLIFLVAVLMLTISSQIGKVAAFVINFLSNFVFCLFIMINQSIVIEDLKAFEAIKRSIEVMKPNVLRYVGFSIVISIISFIVAFILQLIFMNSMIFMVISKLGTIIIGFIFMPISMIFMTLLFKSIPHKPYDNQEASGHYIDSDDLYFQHDERSNEGLYSEE